MPSVRLRPAGALLAALLLLSACSSTDPVAPTPAPSASATALPPVSASPSARPSVSAGEPSGSLDPTPSPTSGTTYTVQSGDNLYRIGLRFGASVTQLQAWNVGTYPQLSDPDTLQAGWVLTVSGDPDATPLPTVAATPRATPPPTASGCRSGNRVAAGSTQTLDHIQTGGKSMAITLDMGGRLDPAIDILNYLIANKVCTTIFATGAMAQTATGQLILGIVREHPELFEVGNHTMHHCDLVRGGGGSPTEAPCTAGQTGTPPTADFIRNELTTTAAILKRYSGQDPRPYWRPPYGSVNSAVVAAAASAGYTKTLLWSIDTIDWKPISEGGPTGQQIASRVMAGATDGWIVLDHLGGYETYKALQIMVPGLRKAGFTLTTISDLLN